MNRGVLVLNTGSSSIKFALFGLHDDRIGHTELKGQVDGLGAQPRLRATFRDAATAVDEPLTPGERPGSLHERALNVLMPWLDRHCDRWRIEAVGHRVVHGGDLFDGPARIDDDVLSRLDALVPLAPLHQPHNIAAIRAVAAARPELPQVACFDTAFHSSHRRLERMFALPRALYESGVRRYGFHGLSYEHLAAVLPDVVGARARARVVAAHLGNGASLCAMSGGRSVASTMGFTALDGLMMGTRSGSVDPGVLLHLLQSGGMDVARLSRLLYQESGLLGVSGLSHDMRVLLASASAEAREAIDLYCYRITRELGSLAAVLGGLDVLVFTGGIGENAAPIRAQVCAQAQWLGVRLDAAANARTGPKISGAESAVDVVVIPADEERVIARQTARTVSAATA